MNLPSIRCCRRCTADKRSDADTTRDVRDSSWIIHSSRIRALVNRMFILIPTMNHHWLLYKLQWSVFLFVSRGSPLSFAMALSSHFLLVLLWAVSLFHVPVLAEYGETEQCKDLLQRREWCDLLIDLSSFRFTDSFRQAKAWWHRKGQLHQSCQVFTSSSPSSQKYSGR